jgi:zinc protease
MLKIKQLLLLLLLTTCSLLFGEAIPDSKNLLVGTLPNGLTYYIYKNQKPEGKASLNLIVASGSLNETDEQQGLAHLLEHMAFNGSTKFQKNELVKYLQSIGLNFGGDLNAHTSFDETVYKLQIPTKTTADIDKGVEVLREWASEVSLSKEEVEKEKPIVLEEWRLRQGLAQRLGDIKKKAIFGDSRYFDRFPIGLPETINRASSELLRDYYTRWYNPKNMAVAAVGDFNPMEVEEIIKKYFNYEPKNNFVDGEKYYLSKIKKNSVVFTDPELTYISFEFTTRKDHKILNETENYKSYFVDTLLTGILNTRLSSISKKKNSPILEGAFYSYELNKKDDLVTMIVALKEDQVQEGIEMMLSELKNIAFNGPTKNELSLEKEQLLKNLENIKNNKSSLTHEDLIEELRNRFLSDESFLEPEEALELYKKLEISITPQDIEARAKEIYEEDGVYFLAAPKSAETKLPSQQQILEIAKKIKDTPLVKNNNDEIDLTLQSPDLTNGSIVFTENLKDYDKLALSNGIELFYKETDFDKDKIFIKIFKEEGSSNNTQEEYLNLRLAPTIIANSTIGNIKGENLELFMKGKSFSVSPYISDYESGIELVTTKADLTTALDFMTYLLLHPQVDADIFDAVIQQQQEAIKNRENSPNTIYRDRIKAILSQENLRRLPMTLEQLNSISPEKILQLYSNKFSNFKNFNIIVVGAIDRTELDKITKKYFASLPVKELSETWKDLGIKAPTQIIQEKVVKGIDKKATVSLIYPYHGTYSNENRILYSGLADILDIMLLDELREKIGGVYSVRAVANTSPENHGEDFLQIRFSTETGKAEMLANKVKEILTNMENGEIDQKALDSVVKNYNFNYEPMLKTNRYWTTSIYKRTIKQSKFNTFTPEEYSSLITKENMINFMKEAVDLNNYIEVILLPEKTE